MFGKTSKPEAQKDLGDREAALRPSFHHAVFGTLCRTLTFESDMQGNYKSRMYREAEYIAGEGWCLFDVEVRPWGGDIKKIDTPSMRRAPVRGKFKMKFIEAIEELSDYENKKIAVGDFTFDEDEVQALGLSYFRTLAEKEVMMFDTDGKPHPTLRGKPYSDVMFPADAFERAQKAYAEKNKAIITLPVGALPEQALAIPQRLLNEYLDFKKVATIFANMLAHIDVFVKGGKVPVPGGGVVLEKDRVNYTLQYHIQTQQSDFTRFIAENTRFDLIDDRKAFLRHIEASMDMVCCYAEIIHAKELYKRIHIEHEQYARSCRNISTANITGFARQQIKTAEQKYAQGRQQRMKPRELTYNERYGHTDRSPETILAAMKSRAEGHEEGFAKGIEEALKAVEFVSAPPEPLNESKIEEYRKAIDESVQFATKKLRSLGYDEDTAAAFVKMNVMNDAITTDMLVEKVKELAAWTEKVENTLKGAQKKDDPFLINAQPPQIIARPT